MIQEFIMNDVQMELEATLTEGALTLSDITFTRFDTFTDEVKEELHFEGFVLELETDPEYEVIYNLYLLRKPTDNIYVNRTVIYSPEDLQLSFYDDRSLLHNLGQVILRPNQEPSVALYKIVKGVISYE